MFASGNPEPPSALSSGSGLSHMFSYRNWSRLPGDVWYMIGLRLDTPSDRIRFRAVSKSLRSQLPYRPPPCLLLSEFLNDSSDSEDDDSEDEYDIRCVDCKRVPSLPQRRFFILGEQKRYHKFHLPQAHLARCIGSTGNWVITVKLDNIIRLLDPFSKIEIQLPDGLTFGDPYIQVTSFPPNDDTPWRDWFLKKAIMSPSTSDFLVFAVHAKGMIAMARPSDSSWTYIKFATPKFSPAVRDIIVYNGLLYAITFGGILLSCDFLNTNPEPPLLYSVAQFDVLPVQFDYDVLYLVEWCGNLLLVIKYVNRFGVRKDNGRYETIPFYKTERFRVFQFDFTNKNWFEIKSLGEYSLFLGFNTSVSVLASDYFGFVKKNCIYFTDDFHFAYQGSDTPGGYDMGVFNLDDNSITPHYRGVSTCYYSPPIWIVPN